jgi:16S rRNA G1207 methylase RsmC
MTSHRVSRRTFPRRGCPAGAGDHQRQRQPPVEHAPPVIGQVEHEHEPEHPVPLLRQAPYPLPVRTVQLEHARRQLAPAARLTVPTRRRQGVHAIGETAEPTSLDDHAVE